MDMTPERLDILDQLFDGVYLLDLDGKVLFWNRGAERLTGFTRQEVVGRRCGDGLLMHVSPAGDRLCGEPCPMRACMADGQPRVAEAFLHHKDGHRIPVQIHGAPLRDAEGRIVGAVEVFADDSRSLALRERSAELERLALWDDMLSLPNRRYLCQHLESRMAEFQRTGLSFGILILDIDLFKNINDTLGHLAGDAALKTVARTLEAARRSYDVVGRWGGEEFLAVLPSVEPQILHEIAERFRLSAEFSTIRHEDKTISLTLSIGGSCAREGDTLDTLFQRADKFLYESKQAGRNRSTVA